MMNRIFFRPNKIGGCKFSKRISRLRPRCAPLQSRLKEIVSFSMMSGRSTICISLYISLALFLNSAQMSLCWSIPPLSTHQMSAFAAAPVSRSYISVHQHFRRGVVLASRPLGELGLKKGSFRCNFLSTLSTSSLLAMRAEGERQQGVALQAGEGGQLTEADRIALWDEIEGIELEMRVAAEGERFEAAAMLRDRMNALRQRDPYVNAEGELKKAVDEER